jgi:hypothetical protein
MGEGRHPAARNMPKSVAGCLVAEVNTDTRTGGIVGEGTLYLTEQGTFILHYYEPSSGWSEYATRWLIANGHHSCLAQLELQAEVRNLQC